MTHVVDFRLLETADDLATLVGCRTDLVSGVVAKPKTHFRHHRLPKRRRKGFRDVWEAKSDELRDALKSLARRLDVFLRDVVPGFPHQAAHGYVARRSIRTNAEVHLRSERILRVDIKSFFPSITRERITSFFVQIGMKPKGAEVLARFVTVDGALPLGLHTSPVLANAVCQRLDKKLEVLSLPGAYTRYADDLTFSGSTIPSEIDIASVLEEEGFELAREKLKLMHRGRGLYVTGLSVEDRERPRAARLLKRTLRQEVHYARTYGLYDHLARAGYSTFQSGINKIHGRIQFLRGIERDLGNKLHTEWMEVLKTANEAPTFIARRGNGSRDVLLVVDESEIESGIGKVLLLGCVAIEDSSYVRDHVAAELRRMVVDPFEAGRKDTLKKKGLHWADLVEDGRTQVVKLMSRLPVRVFVAYQTLGANSPPDYEDRYLAMLAHLIEPRLVRYDGCRITIAIEENPKVSTTKLTALMSNLYGRLEARESRRPLVAPTVLVQKKGDEPCLSVVDAFLGALGAYAISRQQSPVSSLHAKLRFERLRDRYRMIRDEDSQIVFSRRRPFEAWPDKSLDKA